MENIFDSAGPTKHEAKRSISRGGTPEASAPLETLAAMALALRLGRAIVVASTSSPLLLPAASASISRPLSLAPFVPLPRPWLLPGAAAGFRSTAAAAAAAAAGCKNPPAEDGCDYKHWLVTMRFSDPQPSRDEMIETYLQTLAKVVGSYEEAKRRMYAFSTTTYTGFQATMTWETATQFYGLPGVRNVWPDAYAYPDRKEYGGDKYDKGVITPLLPPYYWGKSSRPDRSHTFQRNNENSRPSQEGSQQNSSSLRKEVTSTAIRNKESSHQ
ncbi:hypothetical protein U9M48_041315 [Paspalum notatum var. saurae]|uniref:MORF/ORRM1/DAG-like MORF domain-containing protein n=1 Tax=Paspalum notatum var. saurae TaxID=547442 RepID=A0AAQ3UQ33_PASNO